MAVDVGNTQTVLGLFEGDELRRQWRLATEAQRTSDELAVLFAGLLALNGLELGEAGAMIVSSVVPGLTRSYRHLAEDVLGVPFYLVGPDMETGLKNRYDEPAAVGADRIVNAVAAGHHYGFPAIIVDIGTATTVEAVDGEGCYLGVRSSPASTLPSTPSSPAPPSSRAWTSKRIPERNSHQHSGLHPQRLRLRLRRRDRRPDPPLARRVGRRRRQGSRHWRSRERHHSPLQGDPGVRPRPHSERPACSLRDERLKGFRPQLPGIRSCSTSYPVPVDAET